MKKIIIFILAALLPAIVLNAQAVSPVKSGNNIEIKTEPKKEKTGIAETKQPVKKLAGKKQKTAHVKPVTKKAETAFPTTTLKK